MRRHTLRLGHIHINHTQVGSEWLGHMHIKHTYVLRLGRDSMAFQALKPQFQMNVVSALPPPSHTHVVLRT